VNIVAPAGSFLVVTAVGEFVAGSIGRLRERRARETKEHHLERRAEKDAVPRKMTSWQDLRAIIARTWIFVTRLDSHSHSHSIFQKFSFWNGSGGKPLAGDPTTIQRQW